MLYNSDTGVCCFTSTVSNEQDHPYFDREHAGHIGQSIFSAIEGPEKLYERRGATQGLTTGFKELDRISSGLEGGQMYVIASRPSMGKTALAMNIAEHVALVANKPVAIFSLEMSRIKLAQRLICSLARVNLQKLRDGFISESDFPILCNAASKLADAPIQIEDAPRLFIADLQTKARQLHEAAPGGLSLVVVDYLQLVRSTRRRADENRHVEISEISGELKALAKELDVPILVLSQLNRNPENRLNGRPHLNDLRDSGSIEDDADLVMLLHRPEYYAETEKEPQQVAIQNSWSNAARRACGKIYTTKFSDVSDALLRVLMGNRRAVLGMLIRSGFSLRMARTPVFNFYYKMAEPCVPFPWKERTRRTLFFKTAL